MDNGVHAVDKDTEKTMRYIPMDEVSKRRCRMHAEWGPHRATWIAWPHNRQDWPERFAPIPHVYVEIVRVLTDMGNEKVKIICDSASLYAHIVKLLKNDGCNMDQISFIPMRTDRSWVRDSGAIFVTDDADRRVATLWRFNAWAKYENYARDELVGNGMAAASEADACRIMRRGTHVVMEGGAIDVDGCGNLMATEECLLSEDTQVRNPGYTRADYEDLFRSVLGAQTVIWLANGIGGDDTHGHVDDVARFYAPGKALLVEADHSSHPDYTALRENRNLLESAGIHVESLPMPRVMEYDGVRIPAGYANFYVANEAVLVPTFNDVNDRVALEIIGDCFKDRDVVGIHCGDLVWGFGTLHCATMQEPA